MIQQTILAQIIGILAISFWAISIQEKEQYKILFLQAISNLMYTIQYFLLGVFTASSMNFISFGRCFLFYRKKKYEKSISKSLFIGFILLLVVFGFITYDGYLSLIPIIITIFYTITSYMESSNFIRVIFLLAAFIWIYYNYSVGAYICIVGNVLEIISGVVSLIRFSNIKN